MVVMYLNVIEESSWSCNKNVYTFSYSEKNNNINKITKNELNKKFTAGLHFFSKRLSLNSLSCDRENGGASLTSFLQLVPNIYAGSATL